MNKIQITRKPCESCPYRRDVPSGVWDASEYAKLPLYDSETYSQPHKVFVCRQQNGCLCRGWLDTHDAENSLSLRIAVATGQIELDALEQALEEGPAVPVFSSGEEAAKHGLAEVDSPDAEAWQLMDRLAAKRAKRDRTNRDRT